VRASRWNLVALIVTALMLVVAAGALVLSISIRQDAQARLHRAEATLAHARSRSTDAASEVAKARVAARGLRPQTDAVTTAADAVAPLDTQSLAAVNAAVAAGIAGNVAGYNAAVAQLDAMNSGHDAALEHLRVEVNTLVIALDSLRG
jgi:hypothetical protein